MKSALPCVLTLNGGSSSIRFAVYEAGKTPRRQFYGKIDRIGVGGTNLVVIDPAGKTRAPYRLRASDYRTAVGVLLDWLEAQPVFASVKAAGHRVVHGMKHAGPERITGKLLAELHRFTQYEPDHLPGEIGLIEAFLRCHPKLQAGTRGWVHLVNNLNVSVLWTVAVRFQEFLNFSNYALDSPCTSPFGVESSCTSRTFRC